MTAYERWKAYAQKAGMFDPGGNAWDAQKAQSSWNSWEACEKALASREEAPVASGEPIDMVLHCPKCGLQHVDNREHGHGPYGRTVEWDNPPHRSHLCHGHDCGHVWRPADVPTNGVQAVKTAGKADSPILTSQPGCAVEGEAVASVPIAVLQALRFYARGEHYNVDDEKFDTVSGEPQNWLCHEEDETMIEDGSIARMALLGGKLSWEEDSEPEPIEGEVLAALQVNSTEMTEGAKGSRTDGKEAP